MSPPTDAVLKLSGASGVAFVGSAVVDGMTQSLAGNVTTNLIFHVSQRLKVEITKVDDTKEIVGELTILGHTVSISTSTAPHQGIRFDWQNKPRKIRASSFNY